MVWLADDLELAYGAQVASEPLNIIWGRVLERERVNLHHFIIARFSIRSN